MGRKKGETNTKLHYKLEYKNPITDEWIIKGEYPTIRSMINVVGYNYNTLQNIRLSRHKTLCKYIKITKLNE